MKFDSWLKSEVEYGRELVHSAVEGARSGEEKALAKEPVASMLSRSTWTSIVSGALGASLGLAAGYLGSKRRSARSAAAFGMLGAMIGFGSSIVFSTRQLTAEMARGALTRIGAVRDAHWLQKHPIDYA